MGTYSGIETIDFTTLVGVYSSTVAFLFRLYVLMLLAMLVELLLLEMVLLSIGSVSNFVVSAARDSDIVVIHSETLLFSTSVFTLGEDFFFLGRGSWGSSSGSLSVVNRSCLSSSMVGMSRMIGTGLVSGGVRIGDGESSLIVVSILGGVVVFSMGGSMSESLSLSMNLEVLGALFFFKPLRIMMFNGCSDLPVLRMN